MPELPDVDKDQLSLFQVEKLWEEHWKGMPEFKQEDLTPKKSIIVNFSSDEDMLAFSKLIGQTVTENTRSIWYPEADINTYVNKCFSAEPLPELPKELKPEVKE